MKFPKGLLIITLAFSLGIGVSQFFLQKKDVATHKEAEDHCEEKGEFELSKKSQELIDLKTQEAKLANFTKKIPVVGQIAQEPESSSSVTIPAGGIIAECRAKIGTAVKKDETTCVIKSGDSLLEVKSPVSGIVISDFFKIGEKVDTVSSMHTIADLSMLWATFDVYEKDIADVKTGQKVIVRSIAYPQEIFTGEITFVSIRVDEDTHTIKVRALIRNPGYLLKLGMFVNADIIVESQDKYIVLPAEAVYSIGDEKIVFIKTADEKFQVRQVKIKSQTKDEAAVYEGIDEGEIVVLQDGFLLKSEVLKSQMGEGCAE